MNSKGLACIAFLFNTVLFGTYYAVSKEALGRIDPILFTFFEMVTLVPVAVGILIWTRRQMTRKVLKRGFLLGSSLCLALFTIAIGRGPVEATTNDVRSNDALAPGLVCPHNYGCSTSQSRLLLTIRIEIMKYVTSIIACEAPRDAPLLPLGCTNARVARA